MRVPVRQVAMTSALIASVALAVAAEPLTKRDTRGPVTVSATIAADGTAVAPAIVEASVAERSFAWDLSTAR
jgi:hypothetical protein